MYETLKTKEKTKLSNESLYNMVSSWTTAKKLNSKAKRTMSSIMRVREMNLIILIITVFTLFFYFFFNIMLEDIFNTNNFNKHYHKHPVFNQEISQRTIKYIRQIPRMKKICLLLTWLIKMQGSGTITKSFLFPQVLLESTMPIPLGNHSCTDKLIWKMTSDGAYTVNAGYNWQSRWIIHSKQSLVLFMRIFGPTFGKLMLSQSVPI